MLKISLTILTFLVGIHSFYSQEINPKLHQQYAKEELNLLSKDEIKLLNYAVDHAIVIGDLPIEKSNQITQEITYVDNQTFLDLGLKITDSNQYFKIKGQNKLLIVKSKSWLANELLNAK